MEYNLAKLEIPSTVSQHLLLSKNIHGFDCKKAATEFGPRGKVS